MGEAEGPVMVGPWLAAGSWSAAAPEWRRPAAGSDSEAGAGGTADTKSEESSSVFILGAESEGGSEGRGGAGRRSVTRDSVIRKG